MGGRKLVKVGGRGKRMGTGLVVWDGGSEEGLERGRGLWVKLGRGAGVRREERKDVGTRKLGRAGGWMGVEGWKERWEGEGNATEGGTRGRGDEGKRQVR